jgi:HPr kinase/phosphorylase
MHDNSLIETRTGDDPLTSQLHAVLVRVFDTGVLLIGDSGIGKSECALELIAKGHQLIADDSVRAVANGETLIGKAPALTRHLLEIRGLGIINVPEVFGDTSVVEESVIDLCIEFRRSIEMKPLEDVAFEFEIAGLKVPRFVLPVSPGRNLATLVETAVRLHRIGGTFRNSELLIENHAKLLLHTS